MRISFQICILPIDLFSGLCTSLYLSMSVHFLGVGSRLMIQEKRILFL